LIDSPFIGEEVTNLDYLRSIGFGGKAISVPSQIEKINQVFSPSNEEIEASKTILDAQFFGTLQGQKVVVYAGKKLTTEKIQKARNTIRIANRLKLTDYEIPPMVKHKKIKKIKPAPTKFYSLGEEIANAITHGAGVVVGLVALILLMIKGINHPENSRYLVSGIVFGISVILLYLMSTLYHSLPLKRSAKQVFRCFDHASIYVLIAGSYTPFILLLIDGPMAINVAIIMWGLAITGITMKVIWIKKFSKVHLALYIALGWLPVMFFMGNIAALGTIGLGLLIAGGLAYTVGVVFYALKLFKFTHMVWHLFCIIGTLFHFFAVILYL
jgi:hemolysin III